MINYVELTKQTYTTPEPSPTHRVETGLETEGLDEASEYIFAIRSMQFFFFFKLSELSV